MACRSPSPDAQVDHQFSSPCFDGSNNICVPRLHAGGLDGGLVCLHGGGIGLCLRALLLGLFEGDNAFFFQAGVALCLDPRILRLRLIVFHLTNGFFKVCLERSFVRLKQRLALAYVLSFFEEDFLDLTVDLGPDLHRLVADGADLNRHISLLDIGHDHRRRSTPPETPTAWSWSIRTPLYIHGLDRFWSVTAGTLSRSAELR